LPLHEGLTVWFPPSRALLVGPPEHRLQRRLNLLLAGGLFVATFLAYATGLFAVSGGVVFLAGDAALIGVLGAGLLGYQRSGLVFGWLAVYAPLLGASADHSLLGLSGRSAVDRLAAFLSPDGLVFLGVEAVVIGTIAWAVGVATRFGVDAVRSSAAARGDGA